VDLAFVSGALIGLIQVHGPWIIAVVVALESAGVPLPGETILVAAALLAATTNQIDIAVVVAAAAIGAIIGDGIGYRGRAPLRDAVSSQIRAIQTSR
jgi:membrane protein DedA with SNARE-associated domain